MSEQKLISKRVDFPSVQDIVDEYLPQFIAYFCLADDQAVQMRVGLTKILERFLDRIESASVLGATKGINEACSLIKDPDYYETVKKRRNRLREMRKKGEVERMQERFFSVDVDSVQ